MTGSLSAEAVKWARGQQAGGAAEKAVLLVLAAAVNGSKTCILSAREIAEQAEIERATVYRVLDRLAGRGLVSWTRGVGRAPNLYRLPVPERRRSGDPASPLRIEKTISDQRKRGGFMKHVLTMPLFVLEGR
ncbi:MAG: helix-turn-helix domain-containing protein, partial [Sciscionella sp.]